MVERLQVKTASRNELIDITKNVESIVKKTNTESGVVHIYCPHTTAAITINENCDPSVQRDISESLTKFVPPGAHYAHSEGNADAHIKASLIGSLKTLFIEKGKILVGTWQGIFFCEFDGPRTREVWVKVIQEPSS